MTTQKNLSPETKSILRQPFIIILSVIFIIYLGYEFGKFLFEILN